MAVVNAGDCIGQSCPLPLEDLHGVRVLMDPPVAVNPGQRTKMLGRAS